MYSFSLNKLRKNLLKIGRKSRKNKPCGWDTENPIRRVITQISWISGHITGQSISGERSQWEVKSGRHGGLW